MLLFGLVGALWWLLVCLGPLLVIVVDLVVSCRYLYSSWSIVFSVMYSVEYPVRL